MSTIELVIAVAVLIVASAGLLSISTMTMTGTTDNKDKAAALALAVQKMEDLKNTRLPLLVAGTYSDPNNPLDGSGVTGGIYTRTWSITAGTLSGIPIQELLIRVAWTGGGDVVLRGRVASIPQLDSQYVPYPGAFPTAAVRSWEQQ